MQAGGTGREQRTGDAVTDFAVVVGVARYPELSAEGVAVDLDGPNNDALAVRDWLVDPGRRPA